ncbi:hypothetical protein K501DRAFT_329478 [Backusella circina FSU 941]|nr:hypothetical protein K501DRAFT_329478 [Backusella circina FSU 941]
MSEATAPTKFNFKSLHFAWFVGHVLVLLNATIYFLSLAVFHPVGFFYRAAYLFLVVSYTLVLYNSYMPLIGRESVFKRVLMDESGPYLFTCIYFLFTRRIAVTLLPLYIYSIFHVLKYLENDIIPGLAPHQEKAKESIIDLISKYHQKGLDMAAKIEVFGVMTRLVLGLFVLRSSLFAVLLYGFFLHLRYYMSPFTRAILEDCGKKVDNLVTTHPKVPPAALQFYSKAKNAFANKPPAAVKKTQ